MNVLLSIKPKYVEEIMNGTKQYEFRKVIFKSKQVEKVFIYSSSPVKRIVATFTIGGIVEDSPKNIWEKCKDLSGIDRDNFFDYFKGRAKGYAIRIDDLEQLDEPLDPRKLSSNFTPPQSFCYFDMTTDLEQMS